MTLTPGANTITATATLEGVPLQDSATVTAILTSLSALGPGWTHSFNLYLTRQADGAVSIQDGNGKDVSYYPNGNSIDYTYNTVGHLAQISDALGNKVLYTYDTAREQDSGGEKGPCLGRQDLSRHAV